MKTSVSAEWSNSAKTLTKPVENQRFALPMFAKVGRTLTPPRAGAPVMGHSLLPRWRTRVIKEAPQWFPTCGTSASLGHCELIVGFMSRNT